MRLLRRLLRSPATTLVDVPASLIAALLTVAALACDREPAPTAPSPQADAPIFQISDAPRGGNPHFYFLPPLVSAPTFSGTFDAQLLPQLEVKVCALGGVPASCVTEIATFSASSTPALQADLARDSYKLTLPTKNANLSLTTNYRVRVYATPTASSNPVLLGFADVDVVAKNKDLKNVPVGFVGLVEGSQFALVFRVETGIVGGVAISPAAATISTGATQSFTAAVTDLHGVAVPSPLVAWSIGSPSVASVSPATGTVTLATGLMPGSAVISAVSGGLTGSATLTVVISRAGQVVFTVGNHNGTGQTDVFVMNADGTSARAITNTFAEELHPVWSPDGSRIVMSAFRENETGSHIIVMNADGSNPQPITDPPPDEPGDFTPSWSPDGSKILFCSYRNGGVPGIFTMNVDGSDVALIAGGVPGSPACQPDWSRDGTRIVFSNAGIVTANADGSGLTRLTSDGGNAKWSPDGTRIVFVRGVDFGDGDVGQVFIMNADGTGIAQLTNDPFGNFEPSWAPDGSKIIFVNDRNGGGIYVMDPDGSNVVLVFQDASLGLVDYPSWKP